MQAYLILLCQLVVYNVMNRFYTIIFNRTTYEIKSIGMAPAKKIFCIRMVYDYCIVTNAIGSNHNFIAGIDRVCIN